jgi:hypothetical protein
MNYVGLAHEIDYKKTGLLYIEELKSNIVETNDYITVFINMSYQSNGYSNFIRDNNLINKYIKIYALKRSGIEYLFGPVYVDNLDKISIAIGSLKFDYYTDYMEVIHKYIKNNNIDNYLIYY